MCGVPGGGGFAAHGLSLTTPPGPTRAHIPHPRQRRKDAAGAGGKKRPLLSLSSPALLSLGTAVSPARVLAALEHDHPLAGRELIARACIDLIRSGRFHHPSVVASL